MCLIQFDRKINYKSLIPKDVWELKQDILFFFKLICEEGGANNLQALYVKLENPPAEEKCFFPIVVCKVVFCHAQGGRRMDKNHVPSTCIGD